MRTLPPNVDTALNHNYDTGNRDSRDIYGRYEHHGTAVAGVIAAQDNGIGVRGVAPRATVYGYNFLAGDWQQFEDRNLADAMSRNRVVTAISNNSWGPVDGPGLGLANRHWELAIDSGIREGYEGKGYSMSSPGAMAAQATAKTRMEPWSEVTLIMSENAETTPTSTSSPIITP